MSVADPFTAPGEHAHAAAIPYSERGPAPVESVAAFGIGDGGGVCGLAGRGERIGDAHDALPRGRARS